MGNPSMNHTLTILSLTALSLTAVGCDTTRVERRSKESTTTVAESLPSEGDHRPGKIESQTSTSKPEIVVE